MATTINSSTSTNAVAASGTSGSDILKTLNAGSGMDTSAIVGALVDAERAPAAGAIESRKAKAENIITGMSVLKASLKGLQTALSDLQLQSTFKKEVAINSSSTAFSAAGTAEAIPGNYAVQITQLAAPERFLSIGFGPSGTEKLNNGSAFNLKVTPSSTGTETTLAITDTTPAGIVSAINNDTALNLNARLVDTGEQNYSSAGYGTKETSIKTSALTISAQVGTQSAQTFTVNTGSTLANNVTPIDVVNAINAGFNKMETTFSGTSPASGTPQFVFDGVTVNIGNSKSATEIATAVSAATFTNYTVVDNGSGKVTFTAKNNTASQPSNGSITLSNSSGVSTSSTVTQEKSFDARLIDDADATSPIKIFVTATDGSSEFSLSSTDITFAKSTGNQKVLIGSETGTKNAFSLSVDSSTYTAPTGHKTLSFTNPQDALDAKVTVDGVQITRSSNTVTDVIPGISMDLYSTQATASSVQVNRDTTTIKSMVNEMASVFNNYFTISKELGSLDTSTEFGGLMRGDSTLRSIDSKLKSLLTSQTAAANEVFTASFNNISNLGTQIAFDGTTVTFASGASGSTIAAAMASATYTNWTAENNGDGTVRFTASASGEKTTANRAFTPQSGSGSGTPGVSVTVDKQGRAISRLSDIGIMFDRYGALEVDDTKLSTAVTTNFDALVQMMTANTDDRMGVRPGAKGIAYDINDYLDGLLSTTGNIAIRENAANDTIEKQEDALAALERRMERVRERYVSQFTEMDKAVNEFNNLRESLTSTFDNLPGSNRD